MVARAQSGFPETGPTPEVLEARRRRCRRKFLRYFKRGFRDPAFVEIERGYKWAAHEEWRRKLHPPEIRRLLDANHHDEVAARAIRIESRTNLLFPFEKIALRDALRSRHAARAFAHGLADLAYGSADLKTRFERFAAAVAALPRRRRRVSTWPVQTVFGFIARPKDHLYLKPLVTRRAAEAYAFDFRYTPRPNWETYASLLAFGSQIARDLADLEPRDGIDIQSFIWVLGSPEYPD